MYDVYTLFNSRHNIILSISVIVIIFKQLLLYIVTLGHGVVIHLYINGLT